MSDKVKIALIAGAVALIAVWAIIYFSPHRTCVRTYTGQGSTDTHAEFACRSVN